MSFPAPVAVGLSSRPGGGCNAGSHLLVLNTGSESDRDSSCPSDQSLCGHQSSLEAAWDIGRHSVIAVVVKMPSGLCVGCIPPGPRASAARPRSSAAAGGRVKCAAVLC